MRKIIPHKQLLMWHLSPSQLKVTTCRLRGNSGTTNARCHSTRKLNRRKCKRMPSSTPQKKMVQESRKWLRWFQTRPLRTLSTFLRLNQKWPPWTVRKFRRATAINSSLSAKSPPSNTSSTITSTWRNPLRCLARSTFSFSGTVRCPCGKNRLKGAPGSIRSKRTMMLIICGRESFLHSLANSSRNPMLLEQVYLWERKKDCWWFGWKMVRMRESELTCPTNCVTFWTSTPTVWLFITKSMESRSR